jgi:fatty acid/phospholipid biosynthesis enzyme
LRLERGEAGNRRIADWLASAGSTGAIVASARKRLLPLPGVPRPGLAILLPTHPKPTVLIDAGATADPKPEMLVQFGQLGVAYAQIALSFAGNVEGGDLMAGAVDVIVTDGFTGNVALKTLEDRCGSRQPSCAARSPGRGPGGSAPPACAAPISCAVTASDNKEPG